MKKLKTLILLLIMLLHFFHVSSQKRAVDYEIIDSLTQEPKSLIKYDFFIKPLRLFSGEFVGGYEKIFNENISTSLLFSYKLAVKKTDKTVNGWCRGACGDYKFQNSVNHHYNALGVGLAPSFYVLFPNFYISPEVGYKYWWFDRKQVLFDNAEGYSFDALRTEKANDLVLKLSIGFTYEQPQWRFKNKIPIFNVYGGLDYRSRNFTYESWGGTVNDEPNIYKIEKGNQKMVFPFVGFSVGIGVE
jgi:hypothetical protein